jgi:hypothetical protein
LEGEKLQTALGAIPSLTYIVQSERANATANYGAYSVQVLRTLESQKTGLIGMEIEIDNETEGALNIDTDNIAIRVGKSLYQPKSVELVGMIPGRGQRRGFCVIAPQIHENIDSNTSLRVSVDLGGVSRSGRDSQTGRRKLVSARQ